MRISILIAAFGVLAGCADRSVPPPSAAHPASPNAAEGATTTAPVASASASEHAGHDHAAEAVTYTCPMHPEVVSDKPGQCPKCGMTLVPKKKETP